MMDFFEITFHVYYLVSNNEDKILHMIDRIPHPPRRHCQKIGTQWNKVKCSETFKSISLGYLLVIWGIKICQEKWEHTKE